mmetsp:Transcript_17552/g.54433  ORF Transcript_17552/g.54433 Transcript_17552/m.54433 type:complete len:236 (-) Transcript_17552:1442-2149(-)
MFVCLFNTPRTLLLTLLVMTSHAARKMTPVPTTARRTSAAKPGRPPRTSRRNWPPMMVRTARREFTSERSRMRRPSSDTGHAFPFLLLRLATAFCCPRSASVCMANVSAISSASMCTALRRAAAASREASHSESSTGSASYATLRSDLPARSPARPFMASMPRCCDTAAASSAAPALASATAASASALSASVMRSVRRRNSPRSSASSSAARNAASPSGVAGAKARFSAYGMEAS